MNTACTGTRHFDDMIREIVSTIPGIVYQYISKPGNRGDFLFLSGGVEEMLGLTPDAVYKDAGLIGKCIHPDDRTHVLEALQNANLRNIQFRVVTPAGEKWVQSTAKPQILADGSIIWNGVLLETGNGFQTEADFERLSTYDQLTGLFNRGYFENEMSRLSGSFSPGTVIGVFDIDGLKLVNDTFGHPEGDRLLIEAARIIKSFLRPGDCVARIGGDEFAAIMPGIGKSGAEELCRFIREAFVNQVLDNYRVPFSISLGIVVADEKTTDLAEVYKAAEDIMYREKLHHAGSMRSNIVQALAMALEARDYVTDGHAARLQAMALMLATAVGMPESRFGDLRLLARFHDIGKVAIPDEILFKTGPLTLEERKIMEKHSEFGHRMALTLPELAPIADWILKHHEWWDGGGYPLRIRGADIPLECRIISIVDAYDCMINDRPYRSALSHREAICELRRNAGSQFDAELVEQFINILEGEYSSEV